MAEPHPFDARSPLLQSLFRLYVHAFAWRRFSAVRLARAGVPQKYAGRPLVIYSNHPSWWDPAIFLLAGPLLFPKRKIFGPMAAQELARWRFFRRFGVFGLEPGRRGAATFLRVARAGLADPASALWITAEGSFTDARARPVRLQPGIAHLARALPNVVFLPLALEYVFWNESRPEALLRFGSPLVSDGSGSTAEWTARLTDSLSVTMEALAADSMARDPHRFDVLLRGATQTGLLFQKARSAAPA